MDLGTKIHLKLDPKPVTNLTCKALAKIIENTTQKGAKMTRLSQRVLLQNPPLKPKVVQGKPQGHKIIKIMHFSHQKTTKS